MDLTNLKLRNKKVLVKRYNKTQESGSGPLITGIQNPNMGTLAHVDPDLNPELEAMGLSVGMIVFYATKREQVFVGQEQYEMMDLTNIFAILGYPGH